MTVQLVVTDDRGVAIATRTTVSIAAAPVSTATAAAANQGGGSGGGALSWGWLVGLAIGARALRRPASAARRATAATDNLDP